MIIDEEYLEHVGVKGMRWGHRKNPTGAPHKTNKLARQDAEEMARAKMFYGQGAGTRRKLIKTTVDQRKRIDPAYAKAFDYHLDNQRMDVHAQKAQQERVRKDRIDRTKQQAGAVARRTTGEMGTQAAFAVLALAGTAYMTSPAARKKMNKGFSIAKEAVVRKKNSILIKQVLKREGLA